MINKIYYNLKILNHQFYNNLQILLIFYIDNIDP